MLTYVLRRLAYLVPTLFGITIVTFLVVNMAPGDPVKLINQGVMDSRVSPESYQAMLHLYGLDRPLQERYVIWIRRLMTFDFGDSFIDHRPVIDKIASRLPATLVLNFTSLVIALLLSFPMGLYSAVRQNSRFDKIGGAALYMLYSLPEFWVALLLIMLFGGKLHVLPIQGMESIGAHHLPFGPRVVDLARHMVLPVVCLTYGSLAFLSRFVRGSTLEIFRQDYVRTARAKGLEERKIIFRHVFKNTLIPVVTLLGLLLPTMFSGSVILEYIFGWPGIGQLFLNSVLARDYPVVLALSFITATLVLFSTLLADLIYAWADPRVTYN